MLIILSKTHQLHNKENNNKFSKGAKIRILEKNLIFTKIAQEWIEYFS